ncbi:hypothetical protein VOLCADRAFT_100780 [Volvox carteri f. nagariensis]|uniref:Uncharacterized protein n=1 Tax=Volvox carteri f. nagariensis TaxID=3068 RepID=D8UL07_VOLCA|nr:uncharacterized protein VOLCADRAFT_100780 [Volvox carteri f. nagariensis]EFJ39596.1 hypothetical protein VOLCADRAFT_100780 [Volvox carteri f. nagariensis]|eukprot:XP_002959346.1 hypothetical protein VOLCADRAFT_100780 [Volvox carteri f. nagariensis]
MGWLGWTIVTMGRMQQLQGQVFELKQRLVEAEVKRQPFWLQFGSTGDAAEKDAKESQNGRQQLERRLTLTRWLLAAVSFVLLLAIGALAWAELESPPLGTMTLATITSPAGAGRLLGGAGGGDSGGGVLGTLVALVAAGSVSGPYGPIHKPVPTIAYPGAEGAQSTSLSMRPTGPKADGAVPSVSAPAQKPPYDTGSIYLMPAPGCHRYSRPNWSLRKTLLSHLQQGAAVAPYGGSPSSTATSPAIQP